MYILLVAATRNEIAPTVSWLSENGGVARSVEVEVLITGVGSTATAYALTKQLAERTPELVIQAGIAGSFNPRIEPGSVVFVKEEVFADLGAYAAGEFDDIFDLGLAAADELPFSERMLVNGDFDKWARLDLKPVRGATVNCISSSALQLNAIMNKYDADIESMEGAALHYVCALEEVPYIQLRAISNFAGERDKKNWIMQQAITVLNDKLRELLNLSTTNFKV